MGGGTTERDIETSRERQPRVSRAMSTVTWNAIRCDVLHSWNEKFQIAEWERSGMVAKSWMERIPVVLGRRARADDAGEGGKNGGERAGDAGEGRRRRGWSVQRADGVPEADVEDGGGCGKTESIVRYLVGPLHMEWKARSKTGQATQQPKAYSRRPSATVQLTHSWILVLTMDSTYQLHAKIFLLSHYPNSSTEQHLNQKPQLIFAFLVTFRVRRSNHLGS